jgi:predicted ATPase with chaperone activity
LRLSPVAQSGRTIADLAEGESIRVPHLSMSAGVFFSRGRRRVASVADLAGEQEIRVPLLSEAIGYRRFNRHEVNRF